MPPCASDPASSASLMIRDAAASPSRSDAGPDDSRRDPGVAVPIDEARKVARDRTRLLAASPRVVGRSGRIRTLIEMIEGGTGGHG